MVLEVELSFEGVEDRFDDLAQRLEEPLPGSWFLALTSRAQQLDAGGVEVGLEGTAEVVLVTDHDLSGWVGDQPVGQCWGVSEDLGEHLTFVGLRAGQRPAEREAVHGGDQMQSQTPEEPGVRRAVPVLGLPLGWALTGAKADERQ